MFTWGLTGLLTHGHMVPSRWRPPRAPPWVGAPARGDAGQFRRSTGSGDKSQGRSDSLKQKRHPYLCCWRAPKFKNRTLLRLAAIQLPTISGPLNCLVHRVISTTWMMNHTQMYAHVLHLTGHAASRQTLIGSEHRNNCAARATTHCSYLKYQARAHAFRFGSWICILGEPRSAYDCSMRFGRVFPSQARHPARHAPCFPPTSRRASQSRRLGPQRRGVRRWILFSDGSPHPQK